MCGTLDFQDNANALESLNWREDGIQQEIKADFELKSFKTEINQTVATPSHSKKEANNTTIGSLHINHPHNR